jgi:MerR family regulatory protein
VEEISIGEFARRSRLSLKALRLYDERGVLVPSLRSGQCGGAHRWTLAPRRSGTGARRALAGYLLPG